MPLRFLQDTERQVGRGDVADLVLDSERGQVDLERIEFTGVADEANRPVLDVATRNQVTRLAGNPVFRRQNGILRIQLHTLDSR